MTAGRRRPEKAPTRSQRLVHALLLVLGTPLAGAAWVFLVRAAIDFGRAARNGDGALGWVATVGATVGATTCLLLMFALLARIWATLGLTRQSQPRRSAGAR